MPTDRFQESLPGPVGRLRPHQDANLVEPLPFAVESEQGSDLEVSGCDVERLGDPGPLLQVPESGPSRNAVVDDEEVAAPGVSGHPGLFMNLRVKGKVGAEGPLATREGRPEGMSGRFRRPRTGVSGPKGVVVRLGRAFRRRLETPRRPCDRWGRGRVRRLAVAALSGGPVQGRKPAGEHVPVRRRASGGHRDPAAETVKRAGVRSTRSARRRRLQPVPVTRSSTARWTCMIW